MSTVNNPDIALAEQFRLLFGNGRHFYEYVGCVNAPCEECESLLPLKTGKPHHWTAIFPDGTVDWYGA